ncbi:tetratricopeptide repeat protein [Myxococcota bacterium]|nr:tetratricopeptide repeat protein [Myxococcota bacterium]MBU1430183.1 tetratricopeptide repeat protein [Myxococcota bacterium]MBU1898597.1 tetratricopeptide repeat protein [Myxococcota bacterium]
MRDEAELRGSLDALEGLARVGPLTLLAAKQEARGALSEALSAYVEILQLNLADAEAEAGLQRLEEAGVEDAQSRRLLTRVTLHQQRWLEAAARLEATAGLEPVSRYRRLAQIYLLADEPSAAFDWALKALRADPADVTTVEGIGHFAEAAQESLQLGWLLAEFIPTLSEAERAPLIKALMALCEGPLAAEREPLFLSLYEQDPESEQIVAFLEAPFKRALDEGAPRVEALFALATFREDVLKRPLRALKTLEEIQGLDANHPEIFPRIRHILSRRGDWQTLIDQILDRLLYISDEVERVALFDEAARLYEIQLSQPERAFSITLQAFGEVLDDERYGDELWRLAEASGQRKQLTEHYLAAINQSDREAAAPLRLRLAGWLGAAQPALAAEQLKALLELDPRDEALLETLALRLRQAGDMRGLAEHLGRWADEELDAHKQGELIIQRAEVLEALGDLAEAISARRGLFDIGEDLENLDALEILTEQVGDLEGLVDVLRRRARLVDGEDQVDTYLRLAGHFERHAKLEEAIEAYKDAIYIDDESEAALRGLEHLYRQVSRFEALLEIYKMMLQLEPSRDEHLRILGEVALIQEEELEDTQAAIEVYRELAALAPRDLTALRALERLHRDEGRWDDLADIYTEHLDAITDEGDKTELRRSLSAIFERHLNQPLRAIRVLEPILSALPEDEETLMSMARLHEQAGDAGQAEALWMQIAARAEGPRRLDAWRNAARLLDAHDATSAEALRLQIFEAGGADMETLTALQARFIARGEWPELIALLKRATQPTAASYALLGQAHLELGVLEEAEAGFKAALALDAHEPLALERLSQMYLNEARVEEAAPLLERLIPLLDDDHARGEAYTQLGLIAREAGQAERAREHLSRAIGLGYISQEGLGAYGDLLFEAEALAEAADAYERLLLGFEAALKPEALKALRFRVGRIQARLGVPNRAIEFFRAALSLEPSAHAIRVALLEQLELKQDWAEAIEHRRWIIEALPEGPERREAEEALGDRLAGPVGDAEGAIACYRRALVMPGADQASLLSKLARLSQELGDAPACLDYMRQRARLEAAPEARAAALLALGDQLAEGAPEAALSVYEEALDIDPTQLMAFRNLERLLLKHNDFQGQDAAYRRMLKRAQEHPLEDKFIVTLARNLGEINRASLQRFEEARDAYLIALQYAPKGVQLHSVLADIYLQLNKPREALKHRRKILELTPRNVENLKNLYELFEQLGEADGAVQAARCLVFLGGAEEAHKQVHDQHQRPLLPGSMLEAAHWSLLDHEDKNPQIDQIFAKLYKITVPLMTVTHRELRIHKKKNLITNKVKTPLNQMFEIALQRTGFERVELYQGAGDFQGMRVVNLGQPAILVSPEMLGGLSPALIMFVAARTLYMTTPKYLFAALDRTRDARVRRLLVMVYSLLKSLQPEEAPPRDYLDENLLRAFARCSEIERQGLQFLLNKIGLLNNLGLLNQNSQPNLAAWLESVILTADRLGLLLCDDIAAAAQGVQMTDHGVLSVNARVDALLRFSLSEPYFKLRQALELHSFK